MHRPLLIAAALAALAALCALPSAARAEDGAAAKPRTTQEIIDASTDADWRPLDPQNTLYLELDSGRVVIELAPAFAPAHVDNIRTLARGKYWDGLSINRGHDGFVVQWGDADGEDPKKARPLGEAKASLPAEFARSADGLAFDALPDPDGWAPEVGFVDGFAAARDPGEKLAWLTHCYGSVGAGRGMAPDSSNGSELYVVIGHAPRQLDRNITTVGRVVQGIEKLSVLPRGTGPLGFHEDAAQRTPIRSIRVAADVPEAERTPLEIFRTDTAAWDALVESRRNRRDDWYVRPAGHVEACGLTVPVRAAD